MGWTLDFTGPQMVLTLKLIAVAFCYSDGIRTYAPCNNIRMHTFICTSLTRYETLLYLQCRHTGERTVQKLTLAHPSRTHYI